jgi:stringent starvation protein B
MLIAVEAVYARTGGSGLSFELEEAESLAWRLRSVLDMLWE